MENNTVRRTSGKSKKNKKLVGFFKWCVFALEILVTIVMITGIVLLVTPNAKAKLIASPFGKYFAYFLIDEDDYNENVHDNNFNKDNVQVNPELNTEKMKGYTTIALFGIDARGSEFDKVTHSDSIIVVSINNETGEIKMVSLYRDTYLRITKPDGTGSYNKLNNAYYVGGPEAAINTINTNFDLNITDYAVINFSGLADVIDLLGGIEVNLTKKEMWYVNGYLTETRKITGKDAPDLTKWGENIHLTGLQAVAYCRIRYTAFIDENGESINNDYGRTARQRNVIKKLVDKAKTAGADQLLNMIDIVFKGQSTEKTFSTSLSYETIVNMVPTLLEFSLVQEEGKSGFPYSLGNETINGGSMVIPRTLSYNVSKLHEYLYGDDDYVPTNTVQHISDTIEAISGQGKLPLKEDKEDTN